MLSNREKTFRGMSIDSPIRLSVFIFLAAICFSIMTILHPVLACILFLFALLTVVTFIKLDVVILTCILLFFLLFGIELYIPSYTKKFVEGINVGSYLLVVFSYILWVVRRFAGIDERVSYNYLNNLVILFITWGGITLLWTEDLRHGLNLLTSVICSLILIQLLSIYAQTNRDIYKLLKFLAVIACILGCITFFSKWYLYDRLIDLPIDDMDIRITIGGDPSGLNPEIRRAGGFARPAHAAFALNMFIFVILSFMLKTKGFRKKAKYIGAFFLLIMCIVLTGSKSAFGSMLVGLSFVLMVNSMLKMKRIRWYVFIFCALIISTAIVLTLGEDRIVSSTKGGKSSDIAYKSVSSRKEMWKSGFKDFGDPFTILFGYGIGSSAARAETGPHMHSFYFSALLDLGIIGFIFYGAIILRIFLELIRQIKLSQNIQVINILTCLTGALLTGLINGLVISEFNFPFFWILLAVILSITLKTHSLEGLVIERDLSTKEER